MPHFPTDPGRKMPIYNSIIRPCVMGIPEDGRTQPHPSGSPSPSRWP
nr:MAG TPA: hypothetical protein [Caudoviricetes sp.]